MKQQLYGNMVELVKAATNNVLAGWHKCNPPIMDEQKSEIVERITRYLTDTCRVEAEESRAWAFFYVGELLRANNKETFEQSIDMFKQSLLHGKSSILKYMASSRLASGEDAVQIKYLKLQLEAAEATTLKGSNSKVYALFRLCWYLCRNSQFEEAKRFQEQLSEVKSDDHFLLKVAEGLSSSCEGMIAEAVGDAENSVQACRHAIAILEDINFTEIRDDILSVIHAPMSLAQRFTRKAIADSRAREVLAKARSELFLSDLRENEDWQLSRSSFIKTMEEYMEEQEMRNEMMEDNMYNLFLLLGLIYLIGRDIVEAEDVACKLLEISQRSDDAGLHAYSLIFAAEVVGFCCPMNVDVIESFCVEAQKLVPDDPRNLNLHEMAYTEACLYLGMKKLKEAKEKFQVCIHRLMDIEKNLSRSEWCISYLNQMKACFWSMQRTLLATAMQNENGGPLKITYSHWKSESTVLNGNEVKDALIWAERERARDLLNVIQKKNQDHHAYFNDLSVFDRDDIQAWTELKDVCSLIGQDTVFLVFTARDLFLKTYFLHPGKEEVSAICSKLNERPYLLAIDTLNKDTTTWIAYMCYLFSVYLRPFKQRLEDGEIKKIIIVPNGEMSLVPFAALRDDEDEHQPYLIQKYEISVVSSLRMFKHCERRREHLMIKTGEERSALVVGNSTGDLLQAREEARTVADMRFPFSFLREKEKSKIQETGQGSHTHVQRCNAKPNKSYGLLLQNAGFLTFLSLVVILVWYHWYGV